MDQHLFGGSAEEDLIIARLHSKNSLDDINDDELFDDTDRLMGSATPRTSAMEMLGRGSPQVQWKVTEGTEDGWGDDWGNDSDDADANTLNEYGLESQRSTSSSSSLGGNRAGGGYALDEITPEQIDILRENYPKMRYRLPVRPRVCDYLQLPIRTSTAYVRRLNSTVGWRFVILMTSVYFGIKGTLGTFVGVGQLPYFKEHLKVSGSEYQAYRTAAMTPWAMKALMGAISDSIPIAGYFKRYYIVMASVVGTVAFLLLSTVQLSEGQEWIAALMFMMVHFEMALVDLLCEGAYAAIMSKFAFSGSDIVTWVWTMVHSGGLLAALVVGPLAKAGYIRGMFIICVPIAAQVAIPTLLGYLPEKRLPKNSRGPQIGKMLKHKKILLLAIGMAVAAMGLGICNMIAYEPLTLVYALTSSTLMVVASFSVMPRNLALSNLFLFLLAASYINLGGALDYFYLADKECNPGGPQFDDVYYYTWSSIAQSVFGAVGVLFFQTFLSHWPFRRVFWVTVLLRGVAATVDIIIVNRWNLIIGISDKMMYMVGYNSLYQVIGMLEFMAAVVLTTKMCPKNIESTVYALLAGFQNFGSTVSSSIGVAMMNYFDIRTQIPCDFTHLTTLIVISHMVLPLMCIPLTFVLLPDVSYFILWRLIFDLNIDPLLKRAFIALS